MSPLSGFLALFLVLGLSGLPTPARALATPVGSSQRQEAVPPDSVAAEPARPPAELDALTAQVAAQLRCPVCRNQSVLESSAELARQMQSVIRERLDTGESPEQVKAYFVARYGEWILLKPAARGTNLAVYLLPPLVLLLGALLVRHLLRIWRRNATEASRRADGNRQHADAVTRVATAEPSLAKAPPQGSEADTQELTQADEEWLREALRQE